MYCAKGEDQMAEKCPNCRKNSFLLFPGGDSVGYYSCIYCGYTIRRSNDALHVYIKKFKCDDEKVKTPLQLYEKRRKKKHEINRG